MSSGARRSSLRRTNTNTRAVLVIVAIFVLVLFDAFLVVLAMSSTAEGPNSTRYIEPDHRATPTPTSEPAPEVRPLELSRDLSAASEVIVWRSEKGSCSTGVAPVIETSTNGGIDWVARDLLRYDVREIVAIQVRSASYGIAVAKVGDECTTAGLRSFTGGQFWERADEVLSEFVFIVPGDQPSVMVFGELVSAPCPAPLQAASMAESLYVLCADGAVFALAESGWIPEPVSDGVVALVPGSSAAMFVSIGDPRCPTLFVTGTADESEPGVCVEVAPSSGRMIATAAGEVLWVWIGEWFGAL